MMKQERGIIIYSKSACRNCDRAKTFCNDNEIPYTEVNLDPKDDSYDDCVEELLKTGQTSFPFIYVGDAFIGGYLEFIQAYDTMKLHEMLEKVGVILPENF